MFHALLAALLAALLLSPADAQELRAAGENRSSGRATSQSSRKIAASLRSLIADARSLGITRRNALALDAARRLSSATLKVDPAGRAQVYVWLSDTSAEALSMLERHDFAVEIVNPDFRVVQGWLPIERLELLAREPAVSRIRPASYGVNDIGPVTTQGDALHRCADARAPRFTGAGVKVGVVSNGVDGLATSQAAGELGGVHVIAPGAGDEGTALLEIVHDCAPDAVLLFASNGATSLGLMQAVNALTGAGAHIVVDDRAAFVTEPVFEDSDTALNDRRVGASVLRVSSAGNRGLTHYQGVFVPGPKDPVLDRPLHVFGNGDASLRFRIAASPAGLRHTIVLQWSNRFGAAVDDYDLCVRLSDGTLIGCSVLTQDGTEDPLEAVDVICTGPAGSVCAADVQVTLFSGSPRILRLFCEPNNDCAFDESQTRAGTVVGHKAVPEVLAVAAAAWNSPDVIEAFSSAGPATILFPAEDDRAKPDLTAADRVATSRPGFTSFTGTSASAPHVAGIAALVMQAMGPSANPAVVRDVLRASAVDLGAPGFDGDFGAGRADALAAAQSAAQSAVAALPPELALSAATLPGSRAVPVGTTATAFATIATAGDGMALGCRISAPPGLPLTFSYQTTDPATNIPTGLPDTPASIAGGSLQTFAISLTPTAPFAAEVALSFDCANTEPAPVISGVNTLSLTATTGPTPDIIALGATPTHDGIVTMFGANGTGLFAVATSNVGAGGLITVSVDTGGVPLPVSLSVCQTDPVTAACLGSPASSVPLQIAARATPTFSVFVQAVANIPFDPAANRVFLRFTTTAGTAVGSTSAALRTQ